MKQRKTLIIPKKSNNNKDNYFTECPVMDALLFCNEQGTERCLLSLGNYFDDHRCWNDQSCITGKYFCLYGCNTRVSGVLMPTNATFLLP